MLASPTPKQRVQDGVRDTHVEATARTGRRVSPVRWTEVEFIAEVLGNAVGSVDLGVEVELHRL